MTSDTTPGDSEPGRDRQDQLTRIDGELAQLKREIDGLRGELQDAGPMDAVDRTSIMEQIEERQSVASSLERRRDTLRDTSDG
jgi:hypothetical protein